MMKTVAQEKAIYWGEGGKYGPFDAQQTGEWAGWPDFGQVLRYFGRAAKLSKQEFATLYGKETKPNGSPISLRQAYRQAQSEFHKITTDIRDLESLESQT